MVTAKKPNNKPKQEVSKVEYKCTCCGKSYTSQETNFYMSASRLNKSNNNRMSICKDCVIEIYSDFLKTYNDEKSIYELCKLLDVCFNTNTFNGAKRQSEEQGRNLAQVYFTKINSLGGKNETGLVFADSDKSFDIQNSNQNNDLNISTQSRSKIEDFVVTDEIIDKWGFGFDNTEYYYFEKKYNLLKNNYPEKTAMHTEALFNYIRYRVKEELATAKGEVKEAKDWGALAKDAATAAKINPSQLSKADLSDGLSTFSELSQAVEKEVDIIPILPRFKYRPNDALDFNIWCYVNYIRDLSGLPPCDYEDVYKFYDRRKEEYIKQYGDPYGIFVDDTSKKNREKIKKFINEEGE